MIVGIINPARRNAAAVEYVLLDVCRDRGLPVPTFLYTTADQPGAEQARRAVRAGASRVIVAGGDGTVRHVASSLAGTQTALAIVPTGTANLFALNLGLRRRGRGDRAALYRDLLAAVDGAATLHDIGYVQWTPAARSAGNVAEDWRQETFLAAAGMGADATTVTETSEAAKDRLGWLAYIAAGARHLRRPPAHLAVSVDGGAPVDLRAWSILLGNTPAIPAGITVFPSVRSDSGTLELLRVLPDRPLAWAGVAFHGLRRRPQSATALEYRLVHGVKISSSEPVDLQLDGDAMGSAREAEFWVSHACLRVVLPAPRRPSPEPGPAPEP